tara:strand:+ start:199 stop:2121 length:1923 start_codon:yes stop_codon:yes gene_type:complete
VATRADIEIAVKGIKQVENAKKKIKDLNREINKSNKQITKQAEKDGVVKKGNKTAVGAASQVRSINTLNKNLAKATRNFNRVALGTEDAAEAAIQLKKAQDDLNKAYAEQNKLMGTNNKLSGSALQKQTDIARGKFAGSGPGVFGPQPRPSFAQSIGIKRGFDFQSAAISGAFPLLFGQGPLASLAGGLGGGVGGMFGGLGGFAGGIAATAAVQTIQNAINSVSQLGQALSPITPNIEALSKSLGLVGTEEQKRLQLIEEVRGKQAAFNAAVDEMRRVIGDEATERLREFGESTRLIGNEFSIAMTKMQAALAGLFGAVDRFLGLTRGAEKSQRDRAIAASDNPEIVKRREEIERLQNTTGGGRSGAKSRQDRIRILKAELDELGKQEVKINKITTRRENLNLIESSVSKKLRQENELLQAKLDGNFEEVKLAQEVNEEIQKRLDKGMGLMEIDVEAIKNAKITNRELTKQVDLAEQVNDAFKSLSETVNNDIKEGIKGLIKGTSTLGDLLNNVADRFLDVALNQALFGSILGSKGEKGGGILGAIGLFANGGRPPVGKPSIVGERGPELFVPRSSGTIVPNNKLGGGGSTNVVVNVDASGTDVQGDEAEAKQLGTLISVAVQGELLKQQRPGGLLANTR